MRQVTGRRFTLFVEAQEQRMEPHNGMRLKLVWTVTGWPELLCNRKRVPLEKSACLYAGVSGMP